MSPGSVEKYFPLYLHSAFTALPLRVRGGTGFGRRIFAREQCTHSPPGERDSHHPFPRPPKWISVSSRSQSEPQRIHSASLMPVMQGD